MLCYLIEEKPLKPIHDEAIEAHDTEPEEIDETLDPLEILIRREELESQV